ncbi:MAG: class I SAM-dependent methyltransferase [Prevotella sp.]|jgi:SAM-dependent methyltransferase|nr:class I SAM-dependent methyltransferase [Prevotella sp.]
MEKANDYIKEQFIHLDLKKTGYSIYAIRTSLLSAITSVRPQIKGIVVDLGCGEMPYRDFLLENGNITEYIGIDIQPTEYHNQVKPDMYWDGENIPLPDNHADWFILTEFLEHYHDTQSILKEVHRVLKPGGCIYFTVPCVWPLHEIPYDEYRFTPFSMEKHFKLAGFNKIDIKPSGGMNRSLAITLGVWMENFRIWSPSRFRRYGKRAMLYLLSKFYNYLLKNEQVPEKYQNQTFISGLWGIVKK